MSSKPQRLRSMAMAWGLLGLSLLITWHGWRATRKEANEFLRLRFDQEAERIQDAIEDRLLHYEDTLHGARGLFISSNDVTRDEWQRFIKTIHVSSRYPGLQGVGFSLRIPSKDLPAHIEKIREEGYQKYHIWPEGKRPEYHSVLYIEPFTIRNTRAFGYDMMTEPVRRAAMEHARDNDTPTMSGKLVLVQNLGFNEEEPGFLMYLPVFANNSLTHSVEQRRNALMGYIFAPFRMKKLMAATLADHQGIAIRLRIFDGIQKTSDSLMYDVSLAKPKSEAERKISLSKSVVIRTVDHPWTLEFTSLPGFASANDFLFSTFVLIAGIILSFLLFSLSISLAQIRQRAKSLEEEIDERMKVEEALRHSEAFKSSILESALDCLISIDQNSRIVEWNPAAERTFGYTRDEAIGQNMADLIIPIRFREAHHQGLNHFLKTGEGPVLHKRIELAAIRKDLTEFPVELAITPIRQEGSFFFTAYLRDISERKHSEEEIRKLNENLEKRVIERTSELAKTNKELEQAKEKAEQATEAKSRFLASMSHEIRTPINGILGLTELLNSSELTWKQKEYVEMLDLSGSNLLNLVNDVLDFSKIEAGKLDLEIVPFSLHEIIEKTIKTLSYQASKKNLVLSLEISEDIPDRLIGDPLRLRQIIINLVGNAIKFTSTGSVSLKLEPSSKEEEKIHIHFIVEDTGIGIAEEKLRTIFEPFAQADTSTTRRFGGSGLGLTISTQLIAAMKGKIWVESVVKQGSRFHFEIPFTEDSHSESIPRYHVTGAFVRNLNVLLAEDNMVNQRMVTDILTKYGHTIVVANNGKEAVQHFKTNRFDLILMDGNMPEMDGFEASTTIRSLETNGTRVPIVAMTALAMKGDAEKCLRAGMDLYLSKPLRGKDLIEAIDRLFQHNDPNMNPDQFNQSKPASPVFDKAAALEYAVNDESVLDGIIELLLEQVPSFLEEIQKSLESRDFEALSRTAHSLKGSLGCLGPSRVFDCAKALEEATRRNEITHLPNLVRKLEEAVPEFLSEIKQSRL